jgi:hypothetical protein
VGTFSVSTRCSAIAATSLKIVESFYWSVATSKNGIERNKKVKTEMAETVAKFGARKLI